MNLGTAEMTPETEAIFDEKQWRSLLGVVARNAAAHWALFEMPKRWQSEYARTRLGKQRMGRDNLPFYEANAKRPNRQWIVYARQSKVSGGARGKAGSRVIKAAVTHRVPNVVHKKTLRQFSQIPSNEGTGLGFVVQTLIEKMTNHPNIKTWRKRTNEETRTLLKRLPSVLSSLRRKLQTQNKAG